MPTLNLTFLLALLILATGGNAKANDEQTLTVFAAASLTEPLSVLGAKFSENTGLEVRFSFAASSVLARQISSGANPDLFFSANTRWVDSLAESGLIDEQSRTAVLSNSLVVAAPKTSALAPFTLDQRTKLAALLKPGERIAVGDPDHVPAGIYAAKSLRQLGLWTEIEALLARADNTRAALALIERGEAPLGLVYLTDTKISSEVKILAQLPPLPNDQITYELVIVGNPSKASAKLLTFLTGDIAAEQFKAAQFTILD